MVEPGSTDTSAGRFIPALQFRFLTPIYDFVIGLTIREALLRRMHIDASDSNVIDLGRGTGALACGHRFGA